MPALIALATSVGLLAVLDTWLFVVPFAEHLPGLVWISFIAWGCHFHSGGGVKGSTTAILGMSFGALVGLAAIVLFQGPIAGLGDLAAPVAVGLGAAVICLASAIPLLSTVPASVYGFASVAGATFLVSVGPTMEPTVSIFPTIVSVVIGAAFGFVSEKLANALTKKAPAADAA